MILSGQMLSSAQTYQGYDDLALARPAQLLQSGLQAIRTRPDINDKIDIRTEAGQMMWIQALMDDTRRSSNLQLSDDALLHSDALLASYEAMLARIARTRSQAHVLLVNCDSRNFRQLASMHPDSLRVTEARSDRQVPTILTADERQAYVSADHLWGKEPYGSVQIGRIAADINRQYQETWQRLNGEIQPVKPAPKRWWQRG